MNSETFIIGVAVFTAVFVILQKRRNKRLPPHKCSELWSFVWLLIGLQGLFAGLQSHLVALKLSAEAEPDIFGSTAGLMAYLSVAALFVGMICVAVAVRYFVISRRQRRDYAA
jgi:hypothetical protein